MADDSGGMLNVFTLVQELRSEFNAALAEEHGRTASTFGLIDDRLDKLGKAIAALSQGDETLPQLKGEVQELTNQVNDLRRRMGAHDDARKLDHAAMDDMKTAIVQHGESIAKTQQAITDKAGAA